MKPLSGRGSRQWVMGLTVAAALAVVGLLFGLTQTARAAATSLDGSAKSVSSNMVSPGSIVTYTITLSNDAATPVSSLLVTDALPDAVSYVPLSAHSIPEGAGVPSFDIPNYRHITFTVASVPGNSDVQLVFQALVGPSVAADTVFTNTALISGSGITMTRSVSVTVAAPPSVAIKSPWDNQLITTRGQFAVTGRAWTADQTPGFPGVPVLRVIPDPVPPPQDFYRIAWDAVPGAFTYVLQESLSPHFESTTEFNRDSLTLFVDFTAKSPGTYYYRLVARNAYEGFWSDPISVTVTSPAAMPTESLIRPASSEAALYQPVVRVNINPAAGGTDNWVAATSVTLNAGGWWDWTYNWTLPEANDVQYVIQARAEDQAGHYDPAAVDTVTVTMRNGIKYVYMPIIMKRWPPIPYPPTLSVDSNDNRGNYTLSWVAGAGGITAPTSYWIQEARDAGFTDLVTDQALPVSPTSYAFTNRGGTLYYRVAGVNSYGRGEWSNVITLTSGYYEDFANNTSGWPRTVYQWYGRNAFDAAYENGSYRAKILLNKDGLLNKIMGSVAAPWVNPYSAYDVEVSHYFARAGDQVVEPYGGKGGLIFGANSEFTTIYVVEWNFEGDCSVNKYPGRSAPISRSDIPRTIYRQWGRCNSVKVGYNQTNLVKVTVIGNSATVYINGTEVASFTDSQLGGMHRVGILSGSWERTPVEGRFDDFRVTAR